MSDQKPQSVGAARPAAPREDAIPEDQWAQLLNHARLAEAIASASRMSGAQPPLQQAARSADAPGKETRTPLRRREGRSHPAAQAVPVEHPPAAPVQRPLEPAVQPPARAATPQPAMEEHKHPEAERQPPAEDRQPPAEDRQPPAEGWERERSAPRMSKPPRRPAPSGLPRHEHGAAGGRGRARALAGPVLAAVLVHLVLGAALAAWLLGSDQPGVRLAAEPAPARSPNPGAAPAWQGDVPGAAPADLAPAAGPSPRSSEPARPRSTQEAPSTSQAQANVHKTAALVAASNLAELKMIGEAIAAQEERPRIEPAPPSGRPQAANSALALPAREERAQREPAATPLPGTLTPTVAASGEPRVYLHYTASSPAAGERARRLLTFLRERGVTDPMELRAVDFPIRQGSVRYFFADDRAAARRVSEMLVGFYGADASMAAGLLDLTHYRPRPRPGVLEVWVPSS